MNTTPMQNEPNNLFAPLQAFKLEGLHGRAAFVALRKANEQCEAQITQAMRELAKGSRIAGSPARLQVCLSANRYVLRWAVLSRPVTWKSLQPSMAEMPIPARRHYEALQRRMLELNAMSSMFVGIRGDIRRLMKLSGWEKAGRSE